MLGQTLDMRKREMLASAGRPDKAALVCSRRASRDYAGHCHGVPTMKKLLANAPANPGSIVTPSLPGPPEKSYSAQVNIRVERMLKF